MVETNQRGDNEHFDWQQSRDALLRQWSGDVAGRFSTHRNDNLKCSLFSVTQSFDAPVTGQQYNQLMPNGYLVARKQSLCALDALLFGIITQRGMFIAYH